MKKVLFVLAGAALLALSACGTPAAVAPASDLIGKQAPDFTLNNALGGQTSLSDFLGEPVLLFFHMAVG